MFKLWKLCRERERESKDEGELIEGTLMCFKETFQINNTLIKEPN